jgi:hypothetical protein
MTFNDGANERRERGQVRLRGRKMRALSYGECFYDAIRRGEITSCFYCNRGYMFYTMRKG